MPAGSSADGEPGGPSVDLSNPLRETPASCLSAPSCVSKTTRCFGRPTEEGSPKVPDVVDGDVRGIRLVGIGAASPGRALGLRSGDLVSSIDGAPLKNAQQLLDLFARLDKVSSVELGGTRQGKPLKLTLKLR